MTKDQLKEIVDTLFGLLESLTAGNIFLLAILKTLNAAIDNVGLDVLLLFLQAHGWTSGQAVIDGILDFLEQKFPFFKPLLERVRKLIGDNGVTAELLRSKGCTL